MEPCTLHEKSSKFKQFLLLMFQDCFISCPFFMGCIGLRSSTYTYTHTHTHTHTLLSCQFCVYVVICTSHQIVFWRSNQWQWDGPGLCRVRGTWKLHTGFRWRNAKGKRPLARPRRRWTDNIKVHHEEIGWGRCLGLSSKWPLWTQPWTFCFHIMRRISLVAELVEKDSASLTRHVCCAVSVIGQLDIVSRR